MSAKLLNVFREENPELNKQIGCMTGILQMFDRQHLLSGRRLNGHSHSRLLSGYTLVEGNNHRENHNTSSPQTVLEKNLNKSLNGNRRKSKALSRDSSFSSSCSSFSSLEYNKTTQQVPTFFYQTFQSERAVKNSSEPKISDVNVKSIGRDLHDVVKDSIYLDTRNLVVKTSAKEEVKRVSALKHKDSPRPMHGTYVIGIDGKPRMLMDFNDSMQAMMRLKDAPSSFPCTESPRKPYEVKDDCFSRVSREAHRFSFDAREIKSTNKLAELPRLSLDSRESSIRRSNFNSKSNSILEEIDRRNTNQRVPKASGPSIVAKLMGLEAIPNLRLASDESMVSANSDTSENYNFLNGQKHTIAVKDGRVDQISCSPRTSPRAPNTQKRKDLNLASKPIPNQKSQFQHTAIRQQQTDSVYSQIERGLENLDCLESNQDLRALKQMQSKGLRGNKSVNKQIPTITQKASENSIVVMKPTMTISTSGISSPDFQLEGLSSLRRLQTTDPANRKKCLLNSRVAKDQDRKAIDKRIKNKTKEISPRKNQPQQMQRSPRPQQVSRERNESSAKASGSSSPRPQHRNLEVENSCANSDLSKLPRKSANRQPESDSLRGTLRVKPSPARQNDKVNKMSKQVRDFQQGLEISQRSDTNVSLASHVEVEVTSDYRPPEMNSPSHRQDKLKKCLLMLNEDDSTMELATCAFEQPSPVSVLDASFYQDDLLLSPLKEISHSFKDDEVQPSPHNQWNSTSLNDTSSSELRSKINSDKLDGIKVLVQRLRQLSSTDSKSSAIEDQDQDQHYMSKIFCVSDLLLKHLGSEPVCKSKSCSKPNPEKLHQGLLLDVVTEVLVQKLELLSQGPQPNTLPLSRKKLMGQHLLGELCSDIERVQAHVGGNLDDESSVMGDEVVHCSEGWEDFGNEQSQVVLEMERLIFKDLIDELVGDETNSSLRTKTNSRRRRQLFA